MRPLYVTSELALALTAQRCAATMTVGVRIRTRIWRRPDLPGSSLLLLAMTACPQSSSALRPPVHRRHVVRAGLAAGAGSLRPRPAAGGETVGKDATCDDPSCLGVWDGLLANCPATAGGAGCVCSQDDSSRRVFAEPWDYADLLGAASDDAWEAESRRLLPAIARTSRLRGDGVRVVFREGRYARVVFVDGQTGEESMGEFYYTPGDTTVQFRLASTATRGNGVLSFKNRARGEMIRQELGYQKLPVIRTRPANDLSPGEWALAKVMGLI